MVSIIVPVFNAEKYLDECIKSIFRQRYTDLEIILVDDGSTDNSLSICKKYSSIDNRVVVYSKKNGGVSSARNYGIDRAKGEYIAFADADDILKPELIETLLNCLKKEQVDRVCGGYEHLYENGHRVYRKTRIADGLYKTESLLSVMIDDGTMSGFLFSGVYNSIYLKSIIDTYNIRFRESIKYNEDGLFSFEYALHSNYMYSLRSKPLYLYRQHDESATKQRKKGDKYSALHDYLRRLNFDQDKYQLNRQLKCRAVTIALWEILDIARKEKWSKAMEDIREILISKDVREGLVYIDKNKLNKYKKIYFILIKLKATLLLYILSRYIVPKLTKIISR